MTEEKKEMLTEEKKEMLTEEKKGMMIEEKVKELEKIGFRRYQDDRKDIMIHEKLSFTTEHISNMSDSSFKNLIEKLKEMKDG